MMAHVNGMITSAIHNIELGNEELADGHDVTDEVLDCIAQIKAAVVEIATLTGEVEVDVTSLCAHGEEAKEHMITATGSLAEAYGLPGVSGLLEQNIIAGLRVRDVNHTLGTVQGFMATRPEDYFDTFQNGLEKLTSSTGVVREDLRMAQEGNSAAIIELKKYTNRI